MIKKTDIEKLLRFSKGYSDAEEARYIYSLFADNEGNRGFREHIQQEFDQYLKDHPDENHNLSFLLDRIHHSIHKQEYLEKTRMVKRIYQWYSAAAVLLLPVLIAGTIWLMGQYRGRTATSDATATSTIVAPLGSRISFSLPDGTKGWLNSGSSLEYILPFSNNRKISLIGEAWFDVAHNNDHPFEITAGNSKVKVLGTKFNLSAYPQEKYFELVLEEGKVEFSMPGLKSDIAVQPNRRLVFSKDSLKIFLAGDAGKYSSWKEGKLVFKGDSMDEVARRIGRWYNVDVVVADDELKDYVFRGTFQDDSLDEVLRYISMTSPLRYQIADRMQSDDGTIERKKVLLFKENK